MFRVVLLCYTMGLLHQKKDGTECHKHRHFISLFPLYPTSLPVGCCVLLLQKRQVWCVMLSVQKMDVGVQALTSVSLVHISGLVTAAYRTVTLCQGM